MQKEGDRLKTLEKALIVALVILLLTATIGLLASWQQMQNEKTCPVTVMNVTKNATTAVKPNPQPTPTAKKTLVYIYMTNCPYCEEVKPIVADLITKGFDVQQINTDTNPSAITQYSVRSTPTFVVLHGGKEVARFFGVTDEQTLVNALE